MKKEYKTILNKGAHAIHAIYRVMSAYSINMPDSKISTWVRGELDAVKKEHVIPVAQHMINKYITAGADPNLLASLTDYSHGIGFVTIAKFTMITYNNHVYAVMVTIQKPITFTLFSEKDVMDVFWDNDPHNTHFQDDVYKYNHGLITNVVSSDAKNFIADIVKIFELNKAYLHMNATINSDKEYFLLDIGTIKEREDFLAEEWSNGELQRHIKKIKLGKLDESEIPC